MIDNTVMVKIVFFFLKLIVILISLRQTIKYTFPESHLQLSVCS